MAPGFLVGMYDAACDAGRQPDLIITACGSSLPAAAIGAYPNRQRRNEFLASPDHHAMYLSAKIRRPYACHVLCRFLSTRCRGRLRCLRDTSVFSKPIMEVPLRPLGSHHIQQPFPMGEDVPRIIILAAEIDYCPNCEPRTKEGVKYYRETYFTDADTAHYLDGRPSVIAQQFPKSGVKFTTQVKLGHTLGDAARASISDPYYINLTHLNGRYFATGAVNLNPIELAQSLADEVIIPFYYPSDTLGQSAYGTFFGYSIRKRGLQVNRQWATHWVDFSDLTRIKKDFVFDPIVVPSRRGSCTDGECCCLSPIRVVSGVPVSLGGFQEQLQQQWCYGYERTMEAFQQPVGNQSHIRIPNHWEMKKAKLRSLQSRVR